MKILVGIVTRGRQDLARKAVASALAQEPGPDQVWVIEDGMVGRKFEWNGDGPVRITRWEENLGIVKARNKMMGEDEFDAFVSLDDDAWFVDGDEIARAIHVFENQPKVAAVAFDIQSPDNPTQRARESPREVKMFIGCGHALRLAAVQALGGYEAMPGLYGGEEKDLSLRLMDAGWKIVKLPGTHVWHEKTALSRNALAQRRWSIANDLTFIWRRCPAIWLGPNLLGNAINHILFTFRLPEARLASTLAGMLDFCRAWPRLWNSRLPVRRKTWATYRNLD